MPARTGDVCAGKNRRRPWMAPVALRLRAVHGTHDSTVPVGDQHTWET